MENLTTKYLGLTLKNPLIAASSGLTDDCQKIKELEESGIGAVVVKSLFEEEIVMEMEANLNRMNSLSFVYPETMGFHEENYTPGATDKYLDLISDCKHNVNIPIIASINCVSAKEWTYFPKQAQEAGADAIEINTFILPTDLNRNAEENEKIYFDIIKEVKKQVSIPVSLKISYYFSNLASIIQRLSETGIGGLVLFNRFYNTDFDINKFELTSSSVLSSPQDIHNSLRWISIMSERVKCDLAATTGVHNGEDVVKQLLAGASAIQIASTLYKNGNSQIQNMLNFLTKWMEEKKYASIADFKGKMSQSKSNNPAAYERVQFMKYFRGYEK